MFCSKSRVSSFPDNARHSDNHLSGRGERCSFQAQLIGNRLLDNGTLSRLGLFDTGFRGTLIEKSESDMFLSAGS